MPGSYTRLLLLFAAISVVRFASAEEQCSRTSLNGAYGFAGMGLVPQKTTNGAIRYDPASQVGMATYDSQGQVKVSMGIQYQGRTTQVDFAGTYDVKGNCSGEATFKDTNGNAALIWHFVLVHSGQEIETIALRAAQQSRPMYSLTFTQKKK